MITIYFDGQPIMRFENLEEYKPYVVPVYLPDILALNERVPEAVREVHNNVGFTLRFYNRPAREIFHTEIGKTYELDIVGLEDCIAVRDDLLATFPWLSPTFHVAFPEWNNG